MAWYRSRLGSRAIAIHGHIPQLAVDGGNYVINFSAGRARSTSINVIKN
jgi:hypothetical protein